MRRWGLVIATCYGLVVAVLAVPAFIAFFNSSLGAVTQNILHYFQTALPWIIAIVAAACQALLLFLSVDTSFRRLRPRRHLSVTIALTSLFATVLFAAGVASFVVAIYADNGMEALYAGSVGAKSPQEIATIVGIPVSPLVWPALWLIWAVLFYVHVHGAPQPVARAVGWLLKGSVMELLIAVPAYIVVRQRGDCCAPALTSFGIVSGLAIMLFAFGPGVFVLYKKRYDAYRKFAPPTH